MDKGLLERKQQIKKRIEEVGHVMGIPDPGEAAIIVEIAAIERLTEKVSHLCEVEEQWHRDDFTLKGIIRKAILYLAGLLKEEKIN